MANSSSSGSKEVNFTTKLRHLQFHERDQLLKILAANKSWRVLAGIIRDPEDKSDFLYTSEYIRILDELPNPVEELFEHWATSGREQPVVNDLLQVLKEANLLRAAHFVETEILKVPVDTFEDETPTNQLETLLKAITSPTNAFQETDLLSEIDIDLGDTTIFTLDELSRATNNFCDKTLVEGGCKIGEGGYGVVYKAVIGDQVVAVKKLKKSVDKQFFTELGLLVRCRHENLLALIGCSINIQHCCLVYEYMVNGSLQERLACYRKSAPLTSNQRLFIAYGSALGINYLHTFREEPLVHRDIKSANILLDENLIPKIGDFGLVRIGDSDISSTVQVTQNVCGTSVYMAREAPRGDVSVKLDTFSFGVVLLELITGLPPYDAAREDRDLVTHVESCDDILSLLDPKAGWTSDKALELFSIAELCLINVKKKRPTISKMLEPLKKCWLGDSDVNGNL